MNSLIYAAGVMPPRHFSPEIALKLFMYVSYDILKYNNSWYLFDKPDSVAEHVEWVQDDLALNDVPIVD
ncbi:hypothetical protein [Glaciecola petra]|uniref:Uncharacterized protein n=1 Tax=Glaciecola petra TaxID=3075602 RepID=A0ABU2ZQP3_9ALTE|nr:hypothetical protein [Aestuariibacter sp. P117]MDT0594947.1 hypothetical protein [Aestuariibacter sp. P117]